MIRARFVAAGVGIGLAIAAIATGNQAITGAAIAAMATGLVLGIVIRTRKP